MSNRLFQGVIHQMKDAVDRVIGVIDENGVIISCSELVKIGETAQGVRDELAYTTESITTGGYTYRQIGQGAKSEYIVFVEGEDKMAEKYAMILSVSLSNIKNLYDEKLDKSSFIKNIILDNILPSDIYLKSKELHFNADVNRVVILIKFYGKNDVVPFDMVQNMFPDKNKDYVISVSEHDIVLVKEVKPGHDARELEKVAKNISAAFVSFMQSHSNIREFNPGFINNNGIMEAAIKNILCGNNLALTGPKGVGKNVLVEHLANFFDLELCDMQMSYDTAKEEVRGEPTFLEDGKIGVRLSNIVDAAQRASLINLDEVNMARGSITSLLHSLTDHRRYIEIPGYGMVKVHPQARFTITMNEGDEYEGTRQLNVAFRDRFHEIIFKPNPDSMKDVFMAKCNLNATDAEALAKFYKLIHASVYNADSDACIPDDYLSQRKFVRAGQLYSMGFAASIAEAFREEVVETIADPEIKGIIENLILMNC